MRPASDLSLTFPRTGTMILPYSVYEHYPEVEHVREHDGLDGGFQCGSGDRCKSGCPGRMGRQSVRRFDGRQLVLLRERRRVDDHRQRGGHGHLGQIRHREIRLCTACRRLRDHGHPPADPARRPVRRMGAPGFDDARCAAEQRGQHRILPQQRNRRDRDARRVFLA